MHCRRKLFDEWKNRGSETAHAGVKLIDPIYKAEGPALGLPLEECARMRAAPRTAVEAFLRWADEARDGLSAKSDLAKAIRYAAT